MNEKELFDDVIDYFLVEYNLTLKSPNTDGYIDILKDGKSIGGFTYSNYNLLKNLTNLCNILNGNV